MHAGFMHTLNHKITQWLIINESIIYMSILGYILSTPFSINIKCVLNIYYNSLAGSHSYVYWALSFKMFYMESQHGEDSLIQNSTPYSKYKRNAFALCLGTNKTFLTNLKHAAGQDQEMNKSLAKNTI